MPSIDELRIVYRQGAGVTPQSEAAALADVYRFVLGCHKKDAAGCDQQHDGSDMRGESRNDSHASRKYTK